jgi:LytS/YehU family sensor histidine kinase
LISCLSDFLRLTLNTNKSPQHSLREELEFAHRYLDIERVRFGERLAIEEGIVPESLYVLVPALVLQPLLENAIRHGIEPNEQRGVIRLTARFEADDLVLRVSDTGPGLAQPPSARVGIGLANTRARLQELHGEKAALRLAQGSSGGLEVEIRLPWVPGEPDEQARLQVSG